MDFGRFALALCYFFLHWRARTLSSWCLVLWLCDCIFLQSKQMNISVTLPAIIPNKLSPISSLVTALWYFVVEIGTRQRITRFAVRNSKFNIFLYIYILILIYSYIYIIYSTHKNSDRIWFIVYQTTSTNYQY